MRRRLPETRKARIFKIKVGRAKGYVRAGQFEDGSVGEVFINMDKSIDAGPYGVIGILISMELQRGVELRDIVRKLSYTNFEPQGPTNSQAALGVTISKRGAGNLSMAKSVVDYIVRLLWEVYGDGTDFFKEPVAPLEGGA